MRRRDEIIITKISEEILSANQARVKLEGGLFSDTIEQ